jgi:hypothetical protein
MAQVEIKSLNKGEYGESDTFLIVVSPEGDSNIPDVPFMTAPSYFEDDDGTTYKIFASKQERSRTSLGFIEQTHTWTWIYAAILAADEHGGDPFSVRERKEPVMGDSKFAGWR